MFCGCLGRKLPPRVKLIGTMSQRALLKVGGPLPSYEFKALKELTKKVTLKILK